MAQSNQYDNSIPATHWVENTPILVEALAAAVHTSILDVCEHLEDNYLKVQQELQGRPQSIAEAAAVQVFVADFIAA